MKKTTNAIKHMIDETADEYDLITKTYDDIGTETGEEAVKVMGVNQIEYDIGIGNPDTSIFFTTTELHNNIDIRIDGRLWKVVVKLGDYMYKLQARQ